MIELQKSFKTPTLELINFLNLSETEKEMTRSWRNNPLIRKWMYRDHLIFQKEHQDFIFNLKNDNKNFYWLVKNSSGLCLGVIYLNRVDFNHRQAFLGIYANPESTERGKGVQLFEGLVYLAFAKAQLHTLKLEVFEDNERALTFYRKVGLKEEGRLREFVLRDGKWKDVIIMGIINSDS